MANIKKLYIVLGTGGSRKDFLTGWLGKLPSFIDTKWYIDLTCGASHSDAHLVKIVDTSPKHTFVHLLEKMDIRFSDDAILNLAVNCHGINLADNLKGLSKSQYEILNINVNPNANDTFWQNFVKNFLHYNTSIDQLDDYMNQSILQYIPQVGDTQEEIISNFFSKDNPNFESKMLISNYNQDEVIQFDYNELFVKSGSRILCNRLNLYAPDNVHAFWDAMLPFADPPPEVEFLGKVWKKSDYIK